MDADKHYKTEFDYLMDSIDDLVVYYKYKANRLENLGKIYKTTDFCTEAKILKNISEELSDLWRNAELFQEEYISDEFGKIDSKNDEIN